MARFVKHCPKLHKNWNPFYSLRLQNYPDTPSTWLYVAQSTWTGGFLLTVSNHEGALEPVNSIKRCVWCQTVASKINVLTYPMDFVCFSYLLKTQYFCLYHNGMNNPPLASHPPHPNYTHPYVPLVILQYSCKTLPKRLL